MSHRDILCYSSSAQVVRTERGSAPYMQVTHEMSIRDILYVTAASLPCNGLETRKNHGFFIFIK
jgi:hypothetical protein